MTCLTYINRDLPDDIIFMYEERQSILKRCKELKAKILNKMQSIANDVSTMSYTEKEQVVDNVLECASSVDLALPELDNIIKDCEIYLFEHKEAYERATRQYNTLEINKSISDKAIRSCCEFNA